MEFGEKIKKVREERGMTQQTLVLIHFVKHVYKKIVKM